MRDRSVELNNVVVLYVARCIAEDRGIELKTIAEIEGFLDRLWEEGVCYSPGPLKLEGGKSIGFELKFLRKKWQGPSIKTLEKSLPRFVEFWEHMGSLISEAPSPRPNPDTPFSLN